MTEIVSPKLSVVLVAYTQTAHLLKLIELLSVQGEASSLELIIITPSIQQLSLEMAATEQLAGVQVIEVPSLQSLGQAKATGVRAARSSLIVFVEDHSCPEPGWANALIKSHDQETLAAVGPVMINANPASAVSWGGFLVFYSPWMLDQPNKKMKHLPGNHSCYRRDFLMDYDHQLNELLECESLLHWELIAKGHKLRLEPKSEVRHFNLVNLNLLLIEHYLVSRILPTRLFLSLTKLKGLPVMPIQTWVHE